MEQEVDGRREIPSRNTKWAQTIAAYLAKRSITPNQISILSIIFSAIGGGVLLIAIFTSWISLYTGLGIYILCILLRLLCNLFDGMVAIEGGKKTYNGDLYNDMPDRFSDPLLIIPAGYVAGGCAIELAWLAALLAVMTAYFRWIGAYKTGQHYFNGPMAKPQRMSLLIAAAVISICVIHLNYQREVFLGMLILMNIGLIATLINRLYRIARQQPTKQEDK